MSIHLHLHVKLYLYLHLHLYLNPLRMSAVCVKGVSDPRMAFELHQAFAVKSSLAAGHLNQLELHPQVYM